MASFTSVQPTPISTTTSQSPDMPSGADALILMTALAGAATTKAARKQYRKAMRKVAFSAIGYKVKSIFAPKPRSTAGMPTWLFVVLVIAAAAIGIWLFGLLGFLIVLALGVIIYLLLSKA